MRLQITVPWWLNRTTTHIPFRHLLEEHIRITTCRQEHILLPLWRHVAQLGETAVFHIHSGELRGARHGRGPAVQAPQRRKEALPARPAKEDGKGAARKGQGQRQ